MIFDEDIEKCTISLLCIIFGISILKYKSRVTRDKFIRLSEVHLHWLLIIGVSLLLPICVIMITDGLADPFKIRPHFNHPEKYHLWSSVVLGFAGLFVIIATIKKNYEILSIKKKLYEIQIEQN